MSEKVDYIFHAKKQPVVTYTYYDHHGKYAASRDQAIAYELKTDDVSKFYIRRSITSLAEYNEPYTEFQFSNVTEVVFNLYLEYLSTKSVYSYSSANRLFFQLG